MEMPFVDKDLPEGVLTVRRDICITCPTPCANQHALEFYGKKASSCPLPSPRWRHYGMINAKPKIGLGDAVAIIAQPIAKAIDSVAGTNIQGCGGCKKRQEALNKLVPNL